MHQRLMIHPLLSVITELQAVPTEKLLQHRLTPPKYHQDDELGALVRSYNLNPQSAAVSAADSG
ncbi:MAG: hypothetical protein ACR5LF_04005 [Symbiopectobacterium sp.]